jgi:hypothetical protein
MPPSRRSILAHTLLGLTLLACGDDPAPSPGPDLRDIREKLESVPAIVSITESQVRPEYYVAGRRFFVLELEQPVDHLDPSAGTFRQTASLYYVSADAPMVLAATGYDISRGNVRSEPSALLDANQLLVEHRYFSTSTPDPVRWEHLTVEQAANDFHAIVAALKPFFPGPWVNTGASKGGMTSIYHRMLFPNDVDATIAYVAPNSLDATDDRYIAFVEDVFLRNGEGLCREKVRDLQRAIIAHRDAVEPVMLAEAAADGDAFTLLGATPAEAAARALEFATVEAPFALWQYSGDPARDCDVLLTLSTNAADFATSAELGENLYAFFLVTLGGVGSWFGDDALFHYQSFYYQSATELGGPDYPMTAPGELLASGIADDPRVYPPHAPAKAYDAALMTDAQAWVSTQGERILFVYGENDPWTAGAFTENPARDQVRYTVFGPRHGNHSAAIQWLPLEEQAAAMATLRGWLGLGGPAATSTAPGALRIRAPVPFDEDALLRDRGSHARR